MVSNEYKWPAPLTKETTYIFLLGFFEFLWLENFDKPHSIKMIVFPC